MIQCVCFLSHLDTGSQVTGIEATDMLIITASEDAQVPLLLAAFCSACAFCYYIRLPEVKIAIPAASSESMLLQVHIFSLADALDAAKPAPHLSLSQRALALAVADQVSKYSNS